MENLPPTPEVEEVVQPSPSAAALPPVAPPVAAERKSRSNQVTPRDLPPVPKVRSLSLSRTDNSLQIKAVDDRQVASTVAPPAADVEDSDDPWIQPTLNPTYYVDRSRKTSQGS